MADSLLQDCPELAALELVVNVRPQSVPGFMQYSTALEYGRLLGSRALISRLQVWMGAGLPGVGGSYRAIAPMPQF